MNGERERERERRSAGCRKTDTHHVILLGEKPQGVWSGKEVRMEFLNSLAKLTTFIIAKRWYEAYVHQVGQARRVAQLLDPLVDITQGDRQ